MSTDTSSKPAPEVVSVPTTKILAIGRVTSAGEGAARAGVMPHEVRETVDLYLKGHIDHWFTLTEAAGVVFIMNTADKAEAAALLRSLPLGVAGMMQFELIPVGPLKALRLLV